METRLSLARMLALGAIVWVAGPLRAGAQTLALNGDATASGYGGRPARMIETGTIPSLTVTGPVGGLAWVFIGPRLEPGIPFAGSPNPIHLAGAFDITPILGAATLQLHPGTVPGAGRSETGLVFPAYYEGLLIALQAVVYDPTPPAGYRLTNPIQVVVPGGPTGPAASVEVVLSSPVVVEADNGGSLTLGAVVRDAGGRTIRPTPPLQVSTNAPGATYPGAGRILFPQEGLYTVTVTLTGTQLSATATVRVVPEVQPDQFPQYDAHTGTLLASLEDGVRAAALGDANGVTAAVQALNAGIQTAALPRVESRALFMPLLQSYPTLAQVIGSGQFPAAPDDPQLPGMIASLAQSLQGIQNLLGTGPAAPLSSAQLAELSVRTEELSGLTSAFLARSFSSREAYAQLPSIEPLLNTQFPAVFKRVIELSISGLQSPGGIRNLMTPVSARTQLKLFRKLYEKYLDYLGKLGVQLAAANLIDYLLRPFQNLDLCEICSPNCAAGCNAMSQGCTYEFYGTGLSAPPDRYRILVLNVPSRVSEVVGAFTGHDTIPDRFRTFEVLLANTTFRFFTFPFDSQGIYEPLLCPPNPYPVVHSWPLRRQGTIFPVVSIWVLRMDAQFGISNHIDKLQN